MITIKSQREGLTTLVLIITRKGEETEPFDFM